LNKLLSCSSFLLLSTTLISFRRGDEGNYRFKSERDVITTPHKGNSRQLHLLFSQEARRDKLVARVDAILLVEGNNSYL